MGSFPNIISDYPFYVNPQYLDDVLRANSDKIESFNYITFEIMRTKSQTGVYNCEISSNNRLTIIAGQLYGVTPNIFSVSRDNFKQIYYDKSRLTIGE